MLLFRLHFKFVYFILIDRTITLSQISILSAPSGIFNFCIQSEYKLVGLSGRTSCHPSLRNLYLGKRKFLQKRLTVLAKFVSSPVHWYSSRTFVLLCRLAIFDLDFSNSKDLIFLSFSSTIFNKSCQERLISSSALSYTAASGIESPLDEV